MKENDNNENGIFNRGIEATQKLADAHKASFQVTVFMISM